MWPLPMMHWPSQYSPPATSSSSHIPLHLAIWCGTLPASTPPTTDSWLPSMESCSNLFPWGPSLLLTFGGYWTTYGWKTGGTHPIRMLSCLFTNLIILPFVTLHDMSPPNRVRITAKHTETNFCDESNVNMNKFLMALISSVIYFRLLFTIKLKQEPKKQP